MSKTFPPTPRNRQGLDRYMALVSSFPLRPIRNKSEYASAAKMIDRLAVREEASLESGEQDYLDVLCDLVEAYDERQYQIPRDDREPHEKLKSLVVEQQITQAQLAGILGVANSLASLILSGKRRITVEHARRLGEYFRLDFGYFL